MTTESHNRSDALDAKPGDHRDTPPTPPAEGTLTHLQTICG